MDLGGVLLYFSIDCDNMVGSHSQGQAQPKSLFERAARFTRLSVSQEEGRLHRTMTQEERKTPRGRRPLYHRGAATQGEEGGEVRQEEPPDPDLSHIGEGGEEEVSHRGAPLTRPLPRSGLHSMLDSDTEVEGEWQEVEGRRNRRERRRRRQTDGENNPLPGQGEEGGSTSMAPERDTAPGEEDDGEDMARKLRRLRSESPAPTPFSSAPTPPSPAISLESVDLLAEEAAEQGDLARNPSLISVSLLDEAEDDEHLEMEEEAGAQLPLGGSETRMEEALNVAMGLVLDIERAAHPPAPAPTPTAPERRLPHWQQIQLDNALARARARRAELEASSAPTPTAPTQAAPTPAPSLRNRRTGHTVQRGRGQGDTVGEGTDGEYSQHPTPPVRVVRGLVAGGGVQEELASRRNPTVPGPLPGPILPDGDGWNMIDSMGVWECALTPFFPMEDIPDPYREKWGKAMARILRAILNARDQPSLCRALKWFLVAPQALLRQAKRGGQAGRNAVAVRFNAAMEGDWGALVNLLQTDVAWEQERRRRVAGRVRVPDQGEEKKKERKVALTQLSKGHIGKCSSRLTSPGVADITDPVVMAALREKYPPRHRELPDTVTRGNCVDSLSCLRESLLALKTGVSPGTGGLRGEFLICLAEVWEDEEMELLEQFGLLFLNGGHQGQELPKWWFKVWGSVTTIPLWKTLEKAGLRPIGVSNPLKTIYLRRVIQENHGILTAFLEPQQLALSRAGGQKLVHGVRMTAEANREWPLVKIDMKNAHNEISRACMLEELEAEVTLRHLAWHVACMLAPDNPLETKGEVWGEQEEGQIQGSPEASGLFAVGMHKHVRALDAKLAAHGGSARFGNDDGYATGPPEVLFSSLEEFQEDVREHCGLVLQRSKTEVFSWGVPPPGTPRDMKRAGVEVEGRFEPGLICYGIPIGTKAYTQHMLRVKAEEVAATAEKVCSVLGEDKQALWVLLHRSMAHKMDYHISLCYPTDILPIVEYLDTLLWGVLERAVGQHIPRREEGLGYECVLDLPVDSMAGCSFQELLVRSPIKQGGFGLRSMSHSCLAAYIGSVELSLPYFSGQKGVFRHLEHLVGRGEEAGDSWWRSLRASDCRTDREFWRAWQLLRQEGEQCCNFLGKELGGHLSKGPAAADRQDLGCSSRQPLTEQREELREAVMREALLRHPNKTARPTIAYFQLDRLSTAWKLATPGSVNGLSSKVFMEVMAMHLFLPSLACIEVVGEMVKDSRGNLHPIGVFGDELMSATLVGDSWRWRHDSLKQLLMSVCEDSKIPAEAEVFGLFRHLIPAAVTAEGGEFQEARARNGLCPDLKLRIPTADGVCDQLGEIKMMSACVSRYVPGKTEKQVDRRARELPGTYRRPLARLDREHHRTEPGETGPLVQLLHSFGELQCYVGGAWGEGSAHLHDLIQTCAESRVAHLCRATGKQEMESKMSTLVSQYRRLVSTCLVRSQGQCMISRVSVVSGAAKSAARRREAAGRMEQRLRQEREAQWMANVHGPGWARRGLCHRL